MAQINFRIDDEMKKKAETLFNSLGMTMSSAITVFIAQSINTQGIPFVIRNGKAPNTDLLDAMYDLEHERKHWHFHELIDPDTSSGGKRQTRKHSAAAHISRRNEGNRRHAKAMV